MAFNISDFQGAMITDGARPNLFEVVIPAFDRKLSFTCKATQLPGSTLGVVEVPYFGRNIKFAGNRTFPEWNVTIINDEDFIIRNELENWLSLINGHESNLATNLSGAYQFDASVNQYSKTGDIIKYYDFKGMFPVDIAPIDLDWGQNDTIEEFQVTFAYQYWTSESAS